jgi:AmpD protein
VIIDRASGWIEGVRRVHSPNCDDRPHAEDVSLVVVHGISLPPGEFGGPWIERLFCNDLPPGADPYFAKIEGLKVSAHVLVDRAGTLTQFVPFNLRAWHAGVSEYRGRSACNDFSVGIELEGADDVPYTDAQYDALAALIKALRRAYPKLRGTEVVGHSDISPGRKTDPGAAFDWPRLARLLAARGRPRRK